MGRRDSTIGLIEETESEARERDAFNAAFRELGLRWYWDAATFRVLASIADDGERIRTYLETREAHLLKAYDAAFLVEAVRSAKGRATQGPEIAVESSTRRYADCADFATAQTGF